MATYNEPFMKLTFGGTQAAGQDIWTCGINLSIQNDELVPILPTNAVSAFESYIEDIDADIIDIFSNYIGNSAMDIPTAASLDYIKLAVIGTDGQYIVDAHTWEPADVSGGKSAAYIPQVSLVMTLQSDKRTDPGKYGRFYLPTVVPSISGGYRPVRTQEKADLTANLLASLSRRVRGGLADVRVRPAAVTSASNFSGPYRPFTTVKVGNVFDTQRRRRNKIGEIYEIAEVPESAPIPEPPIGG